MNHDAIKSLGRFLDLVLPPTCHGCGDIIGQTQTLCAPCWSRLTFLGPQCCDACGHPFEFDIPERTLCGACHRDYPPFDKARAALLYDDASRDWVLGYKYADKTEMTALFCKWMAAAGRDVLDGSDVLVPVPLHWMRLFRRRYNQAALLAHGLGRAMEKSVCADGLIRNRKTLSQGQFGRLGRERNVRGAFSVHPKRVHHIEGKRVILIDDVYTTGATLRASALALKRSGAAQVHVLVLARVVRGFV